MAAEKRSFLEPAVLARLALALEFAAARFGIKRIILPDTISNEQKKEHDDLQKKTGHDFDRAYAKLMVSDQGSWCRRFGGIKIKAAKIDSVHEGADVFRYMGQSWKQGATVNTLLTVPNSEGPRLPVGPMFWQYVLGRNSDTDRWVIVDQQSDRIRRLHGWPLRGTPQLALFLSCV